MWGRKPTRRNHGRTPLFSGEPTNCQRTREVHPKTMGPQGR
jgi:hypothetical protein